MLLAVISTIAGLGAAVAFLDGRPRLGLALIVAFFVASWISPPSRYAASGMCGSGRYAYEC